MTEDEKKITYMKMLEANISRMSTASAIFKGFAATVAASALTVNYKDTCLWVLGISFLPVISFLALDVYYLILEHRFRFLYDAVRTGGLVTDFNMKPAFVDSSLVHSMKRLLKEIWTCVKSPSIWLFYPLLLIILLSVFWLKRMEIL